MYSNYNTRSTNPVMVVVVLQPKQPLPDNLPAIVDHDSTFYIRKHEDSVYFGGFEEMDKVTIRDDWFKMGVPLG